MGAVDVVQQFNAEGFQEERAQFSEAGLVDCFLCGRKVAIEKADRMDKMQDGHSITTPLFMHRDCGVAHAQAGDLGVCYENAVRGILNNLVRAGIAPLGVAEYHG